MRAASARVARARKAGPTVARWNVPRSPRLPAARGVGPAGVPEGLVRKRLVNRAVSSVITFLLLLVKRRGATLNGVGHPATGLARMGLSFYPPRSLPASPFHPITVPHLES